MFELRSELRAEAGGEWRPPSSGASGVVALGPGEGRGDQRELEMGRSGSPHVEGTDVKPCPGTGTGHLGC